jgi:hypothetical protein
MGKRRVNESSKSLATASRTTKQTATKPLSPRQKKKTKRDDLPQQGNDSESDGGDPRTHSPPDTPSHRANSVVEIPDDDSEDELSEYYRKY